MSRILYVHQGAELYGSDKVLLNIVTALDRSRYEPIVVLPSQGALVDELRARHVETHVAPVLKVERRHLKSLQGGRLPFDAWRAVRALDTVVGERSVAVVHSNTLAVLAGALWAWRRHVPHLWHVHEILLTPWLLRKGYPRLVSRFSDAAVCNSHATREWLVREAPAVAGRSVVAWNGIDPPGQPGVDSDGAARAGLEIPDSDVVVGLIGRLNRWKGHHLLIDAAERLWAEGHRNVTYLFAGNTAAGQDYWKDGLLQRLSRSPLRDKFVMTPFNPDVYGLWQAVDVAVVPSTEPEPFGMVAVEAMAMGRPVVAAAHGGLTDIVQHESTGLLFEPNNADALAVALVRLISNGDERLRMGLAGRKRQADVFTVRKQVETIAACYAELEGRSEFTRTEARK